MSFFTAECRLAVLVCAATLCSLYFSAGAGAQSRHDSVYDMSLVNPGTDKTMSNGVLRPDRDVDSLLVGTASHIGDLFMGDGISGVFIRQSDGAPGSAFSTIVRGLKSFREVVALIGSKSSCKKLADDIFALEIVHTTALEPSKNASALDAKYSSLNVTNYVSGNRSYSSSGASGDVFPVDEIEKSVEVSTSMELYFVLEGGLRPLPEPSSAAERIYEKARAVLARITDEGMSDYEKVHAIYDFLTTEVVYDDAVAHYSLDRDHDQGLYNDVYRFNCFFPEGVFDDGVAVCNGLAQSFVILCAIEGIDSLKIQGGTSGGRHAWNKVEIDGLWYVVDTTWGAENATSNGVNYRLGDYDWLLVGQNIADEDHHEDEDVLGSDIYCGGVSYDPFANMHFVDEEGVLQDAIADSTQEFNAVLAHYAATYTQSGTYVIAVKITHTYYSQALWREVEGIEGRIKSKSKKNCFRWRTKAISASTAALRILNIP